MNSQLTITLFANLFVTDGNLMWLKKDSQPWSEKPLPKFHTKKNVFFVGKNLLQGMIDIYNMTNYFRDFAFQNICYEMHTEASCVACLGLVN